MKNRKLIQSAALVAFVSTALLAGCSSKHAKALDGKTLKSEDGKYYTVKARIGDTVFLIEVEWERQPKKF